MARAVIPTSGLWSDIASDLNDNFTELYGNNDIILNFADTAARDAWAAANLNFLFNNATYITVIVVADSFFKWTGADQPGTYDNTLWDAIGGGAPPVDSVNGYIGVVVLDPDDLDDTSTTNKFTTAGDISKLAGIEAGADVTDSTNVLASLSGQALAVATIDTGQGANEVYAMDQNVRTSDAVTFLTVDTGQGANELYAMDQPVQTTDSVTFADVDATTGNFGLTQTANSITLGGSVLTSNLVVNAEGATDLAEMLYQRHTNTGTLAPVALYSRSRGTEAAQTVVQSGDDLGRIIFAGHDGTDYEQAAEIEVQVDGTPGAGDMPGRMIFKTSADGTATPTERMRISQDGSITVGGAMTVATIDTGQGAVECYAMDQAVQTTSNVTFADITSTGTFEASGLIQQTRATGSDAVRRYVLGNGSSAAADDLSIDFNFLTGVAGVYTWSNANYSFGVGRNAGSTPTTESAALTDSDFVIGSTGNVGIGETSPAAPLHISGNNGNASYEFIRLENDYNGVNGEVLRENSINFSFADAGGTQRETGRISCISTGDHNGAASEHDGALAFYTMLDINLTEKMRLTDEGRLGLGTSTPQAYFHAMSATAGTDPAWNTSFDKAIFEGSDNTNVTIFTPSTKVGQFAFADPSSRFQGAVRYDHNTDDMIFYTNVTEKFRITDDGKLSTNGETAPDCVAGGMTFFSGGNELLLTSKASTWAHGMTSIVETDTAWAIGSPLIASGGILIRAFTEDSLGYLLESHCTNEITTDTSGSLGNVNINGYTKSGTTRAAMGATANIMVVRDGSNTRAIFKGNGDLHVTNTTLVALDEENDIQLARDLQFATAKDYKHKVSEQGMNKLKEIGAISSEGDFQNLQKMNAVTLGAISQLSNMLGFMADKLGIDKEQLLEEARNYNNTLTY